MTRTLFLLAILGLATSVPAALVFAIGAQSDSLTGKWKLQSVEIDAQKLPMEKLQQTQLVVQGAKYSLTLGDTHLEMTHVLSPNKQPKEMDLTIADGPDKGQLFRAIYQLEGDTLTVCRNIKPGLERPLEFATRPATGLMLVIWTRQK